MTGVTAAGESTPVVFSPAAAGANTLIAFNGMLGDRITGLRIKRVTDVTATNYDVHVYKDVGGTLHAYSVYAIAFDADLKWDFAIDDLNTDAKAAVDRLYVTAQVNSGADPIDIDVELTVAPAIGGN